MGGRWAGASAAQHVCAAYVLGVIISTNECVGGWVGGCLCCACMSMCVHIHHNLTFFYHHTTPVYIVTVIVIVIACVVIIQDTDLSLMEVMVWASSGWCAS